MNLILKIVSSSLLLFLCFIIAQQSEYNDGTLLNYSFSEKHARKTTLPKQLNEISGLAYAGESLIYTHNDEKGIVFKVNIESGEIIKKFYVGNKKLKKDFEGIAVVGDSIFLITSDGVLYRFSEVENNGTAEYHKYKTGLSAKNNIEGLCYDEKTNSLLLACKGSAGKNLKKFKAVYSYDLIEYRLDSKPRFLINLDSLNAKYNIKDFSPTGIEVHPHSGNFYLISSNRKSIIELSEDGKMLNAVKLDSKKHKQPEGITFISDLYLVISDEGQNKKAKVTIIPFQK